MTDTRVGVVGARQSSDGHLLLFLPDGRRDLIAVETTNAELMARYQLDQIIRRPPIDFQAVLAIDGRLSDDEAAKLDKWLHDAQPAEFRRSPTPHAPSKARPTGPDAT